jgi:hypothetical protein
LAISWASRARPRAAASVTMWPASEIRASEFDMKPVTTSISANSRVSASAMPSAFWLRASMKWPWLGVAVEVGVQVVGSWCGVIGHG